MSSFACGDDLTAGNRFKQGKNRQRAIGKPPQKCGSGHESTLIDYVI